MIDAFDKLGIDILGEVDEIMYNMDVDGNGYIDYSELQLSLTDWSVELKEKSLEKVFKAVDGKIKIDSMRVDLIDIKQDDWKRFLRECENDGQYISLSVLKNYLRINIEQ